jgi:hypothetical protein
MAEVSFMAGIRAASSHSSPSAGNHYEGETEGITSMRAEGESAFFGSAGATKRS